MAKRRFLIDVESTSILDLRAVGAHAYWEHPETRVLCVCYRVDDGPVIRWVPGDAAPLCLRTIWPKHWRVVAHNYLFEYAAWEHKLRPLHGWIRPPLSAWDCTMARALYWGLPAGLGDVCDALELPVRKDAGARSLMLQMSRPRSREPLTWWDQTDPAKLKTLIDYCENDVLAECALDDVLPELPRFERELFEIDGEINLRGVQVDLDLVRRLDAMTKTEAQRLNAEMSRLTQGRAKTTNQVAVVLGELQGCVPDLAKDTVAEALGGVLDPLARDILLCRQEAAKASTAKLSAIAKGASRDGRCRGLLQYGGAGRTMRWAGRRAQPQNFPRGSVKGLDSVYPLIEAGITPEDLNPLLPGTVMDGIASMLRGCITASPGHVLVSGDLSQIEARVLCWLADQQDVLRVFTRGEDVYRYQARLQGSSDRQFGKVLTLACGFGMGAARFQETAASYGVDLTLAQAEDAVLGWRAANHKCVQLWWDLDHAFRRIAFSPHGTSMRVGKLMVRKTRKAVRILLPSDHELIYQQVDLQPNPDFENREDITFMGVNSKTKKWERLRTYGAKVCENITQGFARDVMGHGMGLARMRGAMMVLSGHDELLAEAPEANAKIALRDLLNDMTTTPAWAPGLPIAAKGWTGKRYRKDD